MTNQFEDYFEQETVRIPSREAIVRTILEHIDDVQTELSVAAKSLFKRANTIIHHAPWTARGEQIGLANRRHRTYFDMRLIWLMYRRQVVKNDKKYLAQEK